MMQRWASAGATTALHAKGVHPVSVVLALTVALSGEAARPPLKAASELGFGPGVLERFNEQFSHLHVHPSTHRSSLKRSGELPTLVVTFALRSRAKMLQFTLPPGYEPTLDPGRPTSCGIFAPDSSTNYSVFSRATGARPLTPHVSDCETLTTGSGQPVRVTLHLCDGVHGLSLAPQTAPGKETEPLSWWFFHLLAWNPDESPAAEDNVFELRWAQSASTAWAGSTLFDGWPVLGDWDCAYSDWEGWGACSARCGGGRQALRRRVLMEPPIGGTGLNCTEPLERSIPCNEHACLWPCEFSEEQVGECTAECGGGVRIVRVRWHGEHCPDVSDTDAVRREPCNVQPCRSKCRLSDIWTVATDCSELCGPGHFWMLREVLQKDKGDEACQPEWRRLPCLRQRCTPLTVLRPDRNIVPFPDDSFKAAVIFKLPILARMMQLNAPEGFRFGEVGGPCNVTEHDMLPHFASCQVGVRASQAVLRFLTPLPPALPGVRGGPQRLASGEDAPEPFDDRYQFMIDVLNAPCHDTDWVPDFLATTLSCGVSPDGNRWTLEFAEEGTTRWESLSTEGYTLYAPFGAQALASSSSPEEKVEQGQPPATREEVAKPARPRFCSARLQCEDGSRCGQDGLCFSAPLMGA